MKAAILGISCLFIGVTAYGAGDVVKAMEVAVTKVDAAGKTITGKTADGAEHTFHLAKRTTVEGADATAGAATDSWHGLREGSDVVVHYTDRGGKDTAEEVDRVGTDGIKETKGTVTKLDRDGKKMVVKTDDGTEETFDMTDNAAKDSGKDIAKGTEDSTKVAVDYTEEGGKKVVHFFKKVI